MKSIAFESTNPGIDAPPASPRRALLLGAGVAGAAAIAAKALPGASVEPAATVPAAPQPEGGGYQLTQHVLRYYETAKV